MRRNWFLFVRGHHYCSFPQQRELGDFDKQCKDPVGLKRKRVKRVCKSSPALMILRKGNLLWGLFPAAVLFQDDWIITSFDAWFYFWFKDNKEPQTGVGCYGLHDSSVTQQSCSTWRCSFKTGRILAFCSNLWVCLFLVFLTVNGLQDSRLIFTMCDCVKISFNQSKMST